MIRFFSIMIVFFGYCLLINAFVASGFTWGLFKGLLLWIFVIAFLFVFNVGWEQSKYTYINENPRSSQLRAQRQLKKHFHMRFKL